MDDFDDHDDYCEECMGSGWIGCYCGGDLCVCGWEEEPCPHCGHGDFVRMYG